MSTRTLLRDRAGQQRVTNVELFFDLVYVFAVTQVLPEIAVAACAAAVVATVAALDRFLML